MTDILRHSLIYMLMVFIILMAGLAFGFRNLISGIDASDLSRRAEDKEIVQTYIESISMDALESALDTSWRKNNVALIDSDEAVTEMENYIRSKVQEQFGNGKNRLEVKIHDIQIGKGSYSDSGLSYNQTDDQRPYVGGTGEIKIKKLAKSGKNWGKNLTEEDLTQKFSWWVYCNPVPKDAVE